MSWKLARCRTCGSLIEPNADAFRCANISCLQFGTLEEIAFPQDDAAQAPVLQAA